MRNINFALIIVYIVLFSGCSIFTTHDKKSLNQQEVALQLNAHINRSYSNKTKSLLPQSHIKAIKSSGITVLPQGKDYRFILPSDQFFIPNSDELASSAGLSSLAKALLLLEDAPIVISGHSDNVGSDEHKKSLSSRQAERIKSYLWKYGISQNRISTQGLADYYPISKHNCLGNQMNRRIVVHVRNPIV